MSRTLTSVAAALALALTPAAALAANGGHARHPARTVAQHQCNQERNQIGRKAFRNKYGTPHAFQNCVKQHLPADHSAAQQCRAERAQIGRKAFRAKYGRRNALKACIRAHNGA